MRKFLLLIPLLGIASFASAHHSPRDLVSATNQLERATYSMYIRVQEGPRFHHSEEEARALARAARRLNRDARRGAINPVLWRDLEMVERRFRRLKRDMTYSRRGYGHRVSWSSDYGWNVRSRSRTPRGLYRIAAAIDKVENALERRRFRNHRRGYDRPRHRTRDGSRNGRRDKDRKREDYDD